MSTSQTAVFQAFAALKEKDRFVPWGYEPQPLEQGDIEVRVTHNGLCHTDLHMRDNDWGISSYPLVAGHEVVGEVAAVGEKVNGFVVGDRVGIGWIRDSCGTCDHCLQGQENICRVGYTGLIVGNHGGFADRLRVPAEFAFRIPDGLDSVSAAPLLCAGITVYSPLRTHVTRPGMRVGVMGIGGLGHLALQFARAMGAEVVAISTSPSKAEEAKSFGAHSFCQWGNAEALADFAGTMDLVLCTVSADTDWDAAFSLLANNGKLVLVGIPVSSMNIPFIPLVFGQKAIVGSIVGGRHFMQEMLEFAAIHGIKPQTETMPLEQLNEAMDRVAANKARYRIVLVTE